MAGTLLVFDFDKTIIDCDSDNWVIDDLAGTARFEELLFSLPWNIAMDTMMGEFHAHGRTVEEIAESLRRAPISHHTVAAIKTAYAFGCELRIVSDANRFFIETVLDHHGLLGCFSEINTNPSGIDENGRLRISPFHDFVNGAPHGCPLCPPNMCKGKVIERMQVSAFAEGTKRFVYLGDGKGDFCPSLKLGASDFVLPRKGFPVWDLISENRDLIKAEVCEWIDAEEQSKVLICLLERIIAAEVAVSDQPPVDCRQIIAAAHEMVVLASKPLPVRH